MPATPNPSPNTPQSGPSSPPTTVPIVGHWDGPKPGDPAVGRITFELNQPLLVPGYGIVPARRDTVTLDANGSIPAGTELYATDDVGATPFAAVYYRAVIRIDGAGKPDVRYFYLSHLADEIDLSALDQSSTTTPVPAGQPASAHTMTWPQAEAASWPVAHGLGWQTAA